MRNVHDTVKDQIPLMETWARSVRADQGMINMEFLGLWKTTYMQLGARDIWFSWGPADGAKWVLSVDFDIENQPGRFRAVYSFDHLKGPEHTNDPDDAYERAMSGI